MDTKQINVLVVDNNPVIVKTMSSFLIKKGCDVKTADDGLVALDVLRDNPIDIVFTDLLMPLVEGDVLCEIIKRKPEYQHIFVIILSAIPENARNKALKNIPYDICYSKGHILDMGKQVHEALKHYQSHISGNCIDDLKLVGRSITELNNSPNIDSITAELVSKNNYLNLVLGGLNEGVVELDSLGIIVGVNDSATKLINALQVDLIGKTLVNIIEWGEHEPQVKSWIGEQVIMNKANSLDINESAPLILNDRVISCNFKVLTDGDKSFGIVIMHDISRQHHAEIHQLQSDSAFSLMNKMDAIQGMAGGFAHDFNNLLAAICGNLDLILLNGDKSSIADTMSLVKKSKHAADVAVDLTRRVSSFSNFSTIRQNVIELSDTVSDYSKIYFADKNCSVKFDFTQTKNEINGDAEEIKTILSHIFTNSIEASVEKKAEIIINTKRVHFEESQLVSGQYIPAGDYGCIIITDKGVGIEKRNLAKVFDPYFSSKDRGSDKGMGLGLAVVYSLIRNHGGYVALASVPHEKTEVSLYFPIIEQNTENEKIIKPLSVIIEADQQLANLCQVMLVYMGFESIAVKSINELIIFFTSKKWSEIAVDNSHPVVVICDVSDYEVKDLNFLQKELRNNNLEDYRIIGVCDRDKCKDLAVNGLMQIVEKPFDLNLLQHAIASEGIILKPTC
ncbi:MAG: response regulator [Desulfotalea sp.]